MRLMQAIEGLGAMPKGYCFCSKDIIGDNSKVHEPECHDLRQAIEDVGLEADSDWLYSKGFNLNVDDGGHYAERTVGPFTIMLSGDICMEKNCETHLSIIARHPQNPNQLKYSVHYTIADNPTREQVLNLLHGLGDQDE